jgi:hypothetical protein
MIKDKKGVMDRACSMHGTKTEYIQHFSRKPERRLGRPRCRWEVNIKINIREIGCSGMD